MQIFFGLLIDDFDEQIISHTNYKDNSISSAIKEFRTMKTKESLGIFWSFNSDDGLYQEEVDGIIFYSLWKNHIGFNIDCVEFKKIWEVFDGDIKITRWEDDGNANLSIEVYIKKWDDSSWNRVIKESLKWLIEQGAILAWCGSESISPSLEELIIYNRSDPLYKVLAFFMIFSYFRNYQRQRSTQPIL